MLLTITTTHQPATDLGYLMHKHPFRCQYSELPFGKVHIFYPEVTTETCTIAVLMDIDPVALSREKQHHYTDHDLEKYVNDRPFVCSSFMSVVLSRLFGQSLNGKCKEKPELVDKIIPLHCRLSVPASRGGWTFLHRLFKPLGYKASYEPHPLDETFPDWGESPYFTVELSAETTVMQLLNHLYVLLPVLDNRKHYYIDEKEIAKLLKRGKGWLAKHPEKEVITRRYLKYKKTYAKEALTGLMKMEGVSPESVEPTKRPVEEEVEKKLNLDEMRLQAVLTALKESGAEKVLDLGCGEGKLLELLYEEKQFKKIIGMDVSTRSLETAYRKLRFKYLTEHQRERIQLLHGSLMYRDKRLEGFDAAAVVEVIEHLDAPRLEALERVVFECCGLDTIIITTPNKEYNAIWEHIGTEKFRHSDHRFEWTRDEFKAWVLKISETYAYTFKIYPIGNEEEKIGTPTQMAVFKR
ncbi:MAG: 3' terminal RNA ribose 2'-O-methyltransferase Hen1 [bacterium]|nr:3' terminal RNA ribose 2'-O-methyltransferase Hen1 [bacterium]